MRPSVLFLMSGPVHPAAPRCDDVAAQAAALIEQASGLDRLLPIDPRPGVVPPAEV